MNEELKAFYECNFGKYPDLLTFSDLKKILRLGNTVTYKLLRTSIIPSKKVGREYRILKSDVINYFANR